MCVSVCLSVCFPRDLENWMSYHCASFAGVKKSPWRVAQTAFWANTMRASRGKVFETFWQVMRWSPYTHVTLSGYPGQDESCPPLERHWNILEGHRYHSWYCILCEREVDYTIKNLLVCERVMTCCKYFRKLNFPSRGGSMPRLPQ